VYSIAWSNVKYTPRPTVTHSAIWASSHRSSINAMCAHVIVAPEDSRMVVLSKGTSKGLMALIPEGGHADPISTLGLSAAWKKAQKNARKKNTSELMNSTIPRRMPLSTLRVCLPWKVASRVTSRHHCSIVRRTRRRPSPINRWSNLCI